MRDTKLISLFKGLSTDDLRHIQKMLRSPFFTSNDNLLALYNIIRPCHPAYDSTKLEKKNVFKKLFPEHNYSDIKLRNLSSDMVSIIEDYLVYKEVRVDDFERRKQLLKVYKDSGHIDWFERELKKLSDELDAVPYRDADYYKQMLDLKFMQLEHPESKKPESRYELLKEWEEMLDQYYLLSKARHKITVKSLKKILKPSDCDTGNSAEDKNILYSLYQKFDQLYDRDDLDLFAQVKKEFEDNIHIIRPELQREFLTLLINFAIKQMAIDDSQYNKVVLDLYKLGLSHHIIFSTDRISDNAYFNIVVCGAKAKEFDWTLNFIESHDQFLSPETKADIKAISLSTFYFHKQEYIKAIDEIVVHKFKMDQIKVVSKAHTIRCYYEQYLVDESYYDLLIAQVGSNERYVRRKENLPQEKRRAYLNFLTFVKKLATMRIGSKLKPDQQESMIRELSEQEITISRSWLIEVISK